MTDEELLTLAIGLGTYSPDPSTQNGAFLATPDKEPIHATKVWNDIPRGVRNSPHLWDKPVKYAVVEHAERNAIYAAARQGIPTEGLTLVVAWAACTDCARGIIQSGIKEVLTVAGEAHGHWASDIKIAMTMLAEVGVKVRSVPAGIRGAPQLLRNGELISL